MLGVNAGILAAGAAAAPPGQRLYVASGQFVVPDGVYSICAVAIGPGGHWAMANWGAPYGGAGGGLAYSNDIPVTPGEILDISISADSILRRVGSLLVAASGGEFDYDRNRAVAGTGYAGQVRKTGGTNTYNSSGGPVSGAGAAGYTSDGQPGAPGNGNAGRGTSPLGGGPGGSAGTAATQLLATYGGGAGSSVSRGPGCVRILWGPGRAYPSTNTGDM